MTHDMEARRVAYCLGNEPKLDGLYRRFDADSVVKRLLEFGDRTGVRIAQRLL
jgi:hypothetical protein